MPLGSLARARRLTLRALLVTLLMAAVGNTAACSDEDLVDTIPPPRPDRGTTSPAPTGPSGNSTTTSAATATSTSSTTSTISEVEERAGTGGRTVTTGAP